jgi:hypothetical protein
VIAKETSRFKPEEKEQNNYQENAFHVSDE